MQKCMYADRAWGPFEDLAFFEGPLTDLFSGLEATAASKRACRGGLGM